MRRRLLLVALVAFLAPVPVGAAVSPTIRLTISHVVSHCHVWVLGSKQLGASTTVTLRPGGRLVIRTDDPMDFDYVQTAGPRLLLGPKRTYAGQSRTIVFRRPGVYRLRVKNVQTPEERGLVTLGPTNTLTLKVIVK